MSEYCPECENKIKGSPKFCPECGHDLLKEQIGEVELAKKTSEKKHEKEVKNKDKTTKEPVKLLERKSRRKWVAGVIVLVLILSTVFAYSYLGGELPFLPATTQIDSDGDGYNDAVDAFPNDPTEWKDSDNDGVGDNSDYYPNDPSKWKYTSESGSGDDDIDSDNDGLTDKKEREIGTDPLDKDSDDDGLEDGDELDMGTDPMDDSTDGDRYLDGDDIDPLFPVFPDIKISISHYQIYLAQESSESSSEYESNKVDYSITDTTSKTSGWENEIEAGASLGSYTGVYVKDTLTNYDFTNHVLSINAGTQTVSAYEMCKSITTNLPQSFISATIWVENIGTDTLVSDLSEIQLTLYFGDDPMVEGTWFFSTAYDANIAPIEPGKSKPIQVKFYECLSLKVLKEIEQGVPVRIVLEEPYTLGEDQVYLDNGLDKFIRLEIDSGEEVDIQYIDEDGISLLGLLEKYADADIEGGNTIKSVAGKPVGGINRWDVIIPPKSNNPVDIFQRQINKGENIILIYYQDSDGDGLLNRFERTKGLNPDQIDTDDDGLNDYDELFTSYGDFEKTNPLLQDSDFDDLDDGEEVFTGVDGYITDPWNNDTDSDGLIDGDELIFNSNPLNPDSDYDRVNDGDEVAQDTSPTIGTFYPTDDTFITEDGGNNKYGNESFMKIRNRYGDWPWVGDRYIYEWDVLINFDLSSIPSNVAIDQAILHLYYYGKDDKNPENNLLKIYKILEEWDEETTTWNNKPNYSSIHSTYAFVPEDFEMWMNATVTSDVKDFIGGTESNFGWLIYDSEDCGCANIPISKYRTKEYEDSDFHPYLEIELEI